MGNLNVHLDVNFEKMFKELKLILNTTNEKTTERIIEVAYKDIKKEKPQNNH